MRDYSRFHNMKIEKKSRKYNGKSMMIIAGIFIFIILIVMIYPKSDLKNISADSGSIPTAKPLQTKDSSKLISEINNITSKTQGTFAVYIYDLNNKKEYGSNEEMVITAASVNKIAILAALYSLAEKKEIDLEKVIILQQEDMQDYGTGSLRYAKPGTPYSLKTLARLMMKQSDNTAAHIIANLTIGMDKIQQMVNSWGLTQTDLINNKSSVKDMGVLMTKIYNGEIAGIALKKEMFSFMTQTDFEDRIPTGVPQDIKVYHKIGDDTGKIHDVGIVDLPKRPYYLGIMTTDITDEFECKKKIAEISSAVFKYMNNQ